MTTFRHLGDRDAYHGEILHVVRADFESPTGEPFQRDVVRVRGAVATVPIVYADEGTEPEVVLISQYRGTIDQVLLEIPAGMRDVDGEDDRENARRELLEEVGLIAGEIVALTTTWQSPGMTDGDTAIFLADGCTEGERTPLGPEEQHSEIVRMPLRQAVADVVDGTIRDSKSVIGLLLAARHFGF